MGAARGLPPHVPAGASPVPAVGSVRGEKENTMIAAIYARKSTEQNGADAEAKSVARQIEGARAFAAAKGWIVADAHVYADDAVSGAEVKRLVNRQRLLDVISAGPPFQVLIMRDSSRFSRRDGD